MYTRTVHVDPSMVLGERWRHGDYMTFSLREVTLEPLPSLQACCPTTGWGGLRAHLPADEPIQTGPWDPDSPTKPVFTEASAPG